MIECKVRRQPARGCHRNCVFNTQEPLTTAQTKKGNKNMDRNWELFDKLLDFIGGDELALNLCKAMTSDEMNDYLAYIANCFDVKEGGEDD